MTAPTIERAAYARAGLLGNPSDGYGGKAIAVSIPDFRARAQIVAGDRLRISPGPTDLLEFDDFANAAATLRHRRFDDAQRLARACLVAFADHFADSLARADEERGRFELSYDTNIPIQVGLSGSSAIVIAILRALVDWYGVTIEHHDLVELALSAEVDYLKLPGGAMDRVIQVYEGAVLMDLREPRTAASYTSLNPASLPPLFVAWDDRGARPSGVAHGELRARWEAGDRELRSIMQRFRDLVDEGVDALARGDHAAFCECMTRNFELRASFFPIADTDRSMVELARSLGAVAKLCGSGGAVVGATTDARSFGEIERAFAAAGHGWLRLEDLRGTRSGAEST